MRGSGKWGSSELQHPQQPAAPSLVTLSAWHSREMQPREGLAWWQEPCEPWLRADEGEGVPRLPWSTLHPCRLPWGTAVGSAMPWLSLSFSAWLLSTSSVFPSQLSLILHLKSRARGQSVALPPRFLCLISCVHLGAAASSSSAGDRRALLCFMVSKE